MNCSATMSSASLQEISANCFDPFGPVRRSGFISRADVAKFLARQVDDRALIGKTPVLID